MPYSLYCGKTRKHLRAPPRQQPCVGAPLPRFLPAIQIFAVIQLFAVRLLPRGRTLRPESGLAAGEGGEVFVLRWGVRFRNVRSGLRGGWVISTSLVTQWASKETLDPRPCLHSLQTAANLLFAGRGKSAKPV